MSKQSKKVAVKEKPFSRLSRAGKRVALAKDVLALMKSKQILPTRGIYVDPSAFRSRPDHYASDYEQQQVAFDKAGEVEVQTLLPKIKNCQVCGIGALLIAHVDKTDKLKVAELYQFNDQGPIRQHLSQLFTEDELGDIENIFEYVGNSLSADTRMKAIMKHIVKENGKKGLDFKPVAKKLNKKLKVSGFIPDGQWAE